MDCTTGNVAATGSGCSKLTTRFKKAVPSRPHAVEQLACTRLDIAVENAREGAAFVEEWLKSSQGETNARHCKAYLGHI